MPIINMLSSAEKIKGQGVLSAYREQVNLVKYGLDDSFEVVINNPLLKDIVHYHTIDLKFYLSIPFAKLKGTTVAYVHFVPSTIEESLHLPFPVKRVFYKYMISFYKSVDHLVVVNPYFIDILQAYGIEKNKIIYIPNYVSGENFYKLEDDRRRELREKYGIPRDKFVVLGVGQVQHRKGVLDFLKVASELPDVQFVWAGGFSFGVITEGYKELKEKFEAPPANVKFLGIVDRKAMNEVYNLADLMFLPSYQELFPMAVLESMCTNLPILLRDLDIYKNILFNYYLSGNTTEDFTASILMLKNDREFYQHWSSRSEEGHRYYSREHVLELWSRFYTRIYLMKLQELKSRLNEK